MSSIKSWPIYTLLLIGISFFAFKGINSKNIYEPNTVLVDGLELPESGNLTSQIVPDKYEKILRNVMLVLQELHYNPIEIDNNFSKIIFKEYLKNLDVNKDIFIKSDIESLRTKFETNIDDELKLKTKSEFFNNAGEIYKNNLTKIEPLISEILSKPFDFNSKEDYIFDTDKIDYPKDEAARNDIWRKKLKWMTLERYNDLLNQNAKDKVKKTNTQLEKEAREKVQKTITRQFDAMKRRANTDEFFKIYVNTITQQFDPHTDYFPPIDQRGFNEEMSGSYGGIGAQLKEEEGNITIGPLTYDSPAYKSGELEQGDIILSVAQGNAEPVDIAGYSTADVVKLIRGKVDTEVRLTIKKKTKGTIAIVKLTRKLLKLENTFAKSTIINDGDKKVGMIYLPEFYADFEKPDGPRCARDVAAEIMKLKAEGVQGIIMDLRNNGGGSLYDVVQMVGFFIPNGPVVQVKDRKGKIQVQSDNNSDVLWDGPLTVLVNEFSASASEIFVAAIQDYKRGLIIGSTTTFGKGTVQRQIPLNFENDKLLNNDEYGSIKVTLQKFYRISGGSTQLKGVTPDIVIPDTYEYLKYREKDSKTALKWDEIPKANYKTFDEFNFADVITHSNQRIANSPAFNIIKANSQLIEKVADKNYSLNLNDYKAEQKQIKDLSSKMDSVYKVRDSLKVQFMQVDVAKYNSDKDKADNNTKFLNAISKDIYINEAVKVIEDMLNLKQVAIKNK